MSFEDHYKQHTPAYKSKHLGISEITKPNHRTNQNLYKSL